MKFIKIILKRHFERGSFVNDNEEQLKREKYLIGNIKFNRWLLFLGAVLTQVVFGSMYSWSIYNKPIDNAIFGDPNKGMATNTYYIATFIFGCLVSFAGPFFELYGPKKSLSFCGFSFVVGQLITALGIHVKSIWVVYVGYGLFGGIGNCGFLVPVSVLLKWFPDHRGLASGISVCGFGVGSIAFARIPLPIIEHVGLVNNFIIMGAIFSFMFSVSIFIVRNPPHNFQINGIDSNKNKITQQIEMDDTPIPLEEEKLNTIDDEERSPIIIIEPPKFSDYKLSDAITSREFIIFYYIFLSNLTFGVIVVGRLSDMVQNLFFKSANVGSTIVSINGALNLVGRITFALLSDKLGRKNSYIFILSIQIFSIAMVMNSLNHNNFTEFIGFILTASFSNGGSFGVMPALLMDQFGSHNISATNGIIFSCWTIVSLFSIVVFQLSYNYQIHNNGYTIHDSYPYIINFYWIISFVSIGLLLSLFIRTTVQDVFLPPIKGQFIRFNFFNSFSIRISTSNGFEYLSNKQLKSEWDQYLLNLNN